MDLYPVIVAAILVTLALSKHVNRTVNPGFRAQITSKGLTYANSIAIKSLNEKLKSEKLPDFHKSGKLSLDLTELHLTGFNIPTSSLIAQAGSGLKWSASGMSASLNGKFHVKYKAGWFKISDHGTFDVGVSNTDFSLQLIIGVDTSGRPTIHSPSCSCDVGHLSVHFHKSILRKIYDLLVSLVKKNIKENLQKMICKAARKAVDVDAAKSLSKLKVTVPIAKKFLLDYRLTTAPTFDNSIETFHKGEVFWKTDMSEAPFTAPALPPPSSNKNMLYFWISQYMANTFAHAAQTHGYLQVHVNESSIPSSDHGYFNTTCSGIIPTCIGKLIPQIGKAYPNMTVDIWLISTEHPNVVISPSAITLTTNANASFYATKPGTDERHFMFTLVVVSNVSMSVNIEGQIIKGKTGQISVVLTLVDSQIGRISKPLLQLFTDALIKMVVKPKLDEFGAKGFPLPITDNVKFSNSQVIMAQNAFILATDIIYSLHGTPISRVQVMTHTAQQKLVKSFDIDDLIWLMRKRGECGVGANT